MIETDFSKYVNKDAATFDGDKLHQDCFIDPKQQLEKPPIALSCGQGYDGYIPIVTYGNFACLVGASKSYKSFLKSAMAACYIGGKSQSYFNDILGHDTKGKFIIDIDTEQSDYHVQKASRRVLDMVGADYEYYKSFAVRKLDPKERVEFIDWIYNESEYKNNIGIMLIDGAADLVPNVNDLEKCNEVTQKMMSWTQEHNTAIITVIHKNFESNKPTGHLGSSILKKAESVIFINKEDNVAKVTAKYTRNMPFNDFAFRINEVGLPIHNNEFDIF